MPKTHLKSYFGCDEHDVKRCAVVFGVRLDTEFTGGAMITLRYEDSFALSDVQATAAEALGSKDLRRSKSPMKLCVAFGLSR